VLRPDHGRPSLASGSVLVTDLDPQAFERVWPRVVGDLVEELLAVISPLLESHTTTGPAANAPTA
jgi:hypothetical protein